MSHIETETCTKNDRLSAQLETTSNEPAEGSERPRRSERIRTLTEKGRELFAERLRTVQRRYKCLYEKWRYHARVGKEVLNDEASKDELKDLISNIENSCSDVKNIYEELRQMHTPDPELRRRVDTCISLSGFIIQRAERQLEEHTTENEDPWPDVGSVLDSTGSLSRSLSRQSKCDSTPSSILSVKRYEAAAEAAASQEVLAVLGEQEKEATELQRLEAEDKEQLAQFECEKLARQQVIQERRRKLERLEEVKKLKAAKARVKIYDQIEGKIETIDSLPHVKLTRETQTFYSSSPFIPQSPPAQVLNASSPPFIPQQNSQVSNSQDCTSTSQALPIPTFTTQVQNSSDLVHALAEAISVNHLPTPEPTLFTGDPLKFNDWRLSFKTLIDRKGIPKNEKLYYLRRYLGGAARKAAEGFFLLGTEEAYDSAWQLLEKRFGDPFIIGKSFRDKLHGWPKINSKDGCELREFADFLRSCEAAMPHIKTLEVLNDCNESQRILLKLPDWLVSRWNRKAMEAKQANAGYPPFSELVDFLSKEADLACDPISSIQALKRVESEKPKYPRSQTVQAKTLSTNTTQRNIPSCIFCKRTGHILAKCRKFMERTIEDRVKFVHAEKLCFGCLGPGHQSRRCDNKDTCERCQKRHPTCLHNDKFVERKSIPQGGDNNSKDKTDITEISATSNRVLQEKPSTQTSAIIPVWISSTKRPDQEVLVYALLDSQSDTTFILDEVAQDLHTSKENVSLRLSTMSTRSSIIPSQKITNLQVRGYNLDKRIPLPPLFTREFIPADRSHIPTSETALKWPHLEQLADKIPPPLDCEVGLLIGYNCQQALLPREIVSGEENHPFAQRTDLGWSIVGCSNPAKDYGDAIGISHRIIVRQVTPATHPSTKLKGSTLRV